MFYGLGSTSRFEEEYLALEGLSALGQLPAPGSTVYGPVPAEWAGTEKAGAAGPKQKKCEAAGGHWIGPDKKRWCQMPTAIDQITQGMTAPKPAPVPAPTPTIAYPPVATVVSQTLPKKGSFYTGPEPATPPGGWPPYKGAPGPKQKKCLKTGGRWIGPTGQKWCQLSPAPAAPVAPAPQPAPMPAPAPAPQPAPIVQPTAPVIQQPTIQPCPSGYTARGSDCVPTQAAPGPGYELQQYGDSRYYQWVYTGVGVQQPQPQLPSPQPLPAPDYSGDVPPPPMTTPIGDGQLAPEAWDVYPDQGGQIDYGAAPPALQPPLIEPIDDSGYPVDMSAAVSVLTECAADFGQYLPLEYSDQFGKMKVLQVFCAQSSGASAGQAGPQGPIESAEMDALFA